jgi:hypothetical protein
MITTHFTLHEQTLLDSLTAAIAQGLTLNEYVELRLNVHLDTAIELTKSREESDQAVDEVAHELFNIALNQMAEDLGDDYEVKAAIYSVEDLYKQRLTGKAWNLLERETRFMIGKAFERLVDAETLARVPSNGDYQVKVQFNDRTSQNQARYKTVRW